MANLLRYAVWMYYGSIALQTVLVCKLWKKKCPTGFFLYSTFIVGRAVIMAPLLHFGNGGLYAQTYWLVNAIDVILVMWCILEQVGYGPWAGIGAIVGVMCWLNHSIFQIADMGLFLCALIALFVDGVDRSILSGFAVVLGVAGIVALPELPTFCLFVMPGAFLVAQGVWLKGITRVSAP